jgi:signal transduction histidine kinase
VISSFVARNMQSAAYILSFRKVGKLSDIGALCPLLLDLSASVKLAASIQRVLQSSKPENLALPLGPEGDDVWHLTIAPWEDLAAVVVCTATPITAPVGAAGRTGTPLHQVQEMSTGATALSQLLAAICFEMRTQLNAVVASAELFKARPLSELQRDCVQNIEAGSLAMLRAANDALEFEQLLSHTLTLSDAPFDLHDVLVDCLLLAQIYCEPRDRDFSYSIDKNVPAVLRGDGSRLRQIMLSLLNVICKFTTQGTIAFSAGCSEAKSAVNKEPAIALLCQWDVTDAGNEIGKKEQEFVARLLTQEQEREHGGGIGLWNAKRLLHLMGGKLEVLQKQGTLMADWF